jgi:hypothetical protein
MRENIAHQAGGTCVFLRFSAELCSGTIFAKEQGKSGDSVDG